MTKSVPIQTVSPRLLLTRVEIPCKDNRSADKNGPSIRLLAMVVSRSGEVYLQFNAMQCVQTHCSPHLCRENTVPRVRPSCVFWYNDTRPPSTATVHDLSQWDR